MILRAAGKDLLHLGERLPRYERRVYRLHQDGIGAGTVFTSYIEIPPPHNDVPAVDRVTQNFVQPLGIPPPSVVGEDMLLIEHCCDLGGCVSARVEGEDARYDRSIDLIESKLVTSS